MTKKLVITNITQIDEVRKSIINSINIVILRIIELGTSVEPISLFHTLKFEKFGQDPLSSSNLNFIEQLNQSYTYLVSLAGVEFLIKNNPNEIFTLNLGTTSGFDIVSQNSNIIAETFAATTIKSNDKLKKDIQRLQKEPDNIEKYIFYYTLDDEKETEKAKNRYENITIISFSKDEIYIIN